MESPKTLKILNRAIIAGLIVVILSFIFPLVPCKTAPIIAESVYTWSMCKLQNPFTNPILGVSNKFYNLYTDNSAGMIMQFVIISALFILIVIILRKNTGKVLDLTRKR